jgi:hypothetical protein
LIFESRVMGGTRKQGSFALSWLTQRKFDGSADWLQQAQSRAAIVLPDEVHGPIGDAVIEALIERGLAKRRFNVTIPD